MMDSYEAGYVAGAEENTVSSAEADLIASALALADNCPDDLALTECGKRLIEAARSLRMERGPADAN